MKKYVPTLNEWSKKNNPFHGKLIVEDYDLEGKENPAEGDHESKERGNSPFKTEFKKSKTSPVTDRDWESLSDDKKGEILEARIEEYYSMQEEIEDMTKKFEEMMKDFISDKNAMWEEVVEMMTDYKEISGQVRDKLKEKYKIKFQSSYSREVTRGYKELYEILLTKVNPATRDLMTRLKQEVTDTKQAKASFNIKKKKVEEGVLDKMSKWFKKIYDSVMSLFRPAKDKLTQALTELEALDMPTESELSQS